MAALLAVLLFAGAAVASARSSGNARLEYKWSTQWRMGVQKAMRSQFDFNGGRLTIQPGREILIGPFVLKLWKRSRVLRPIGTNTVAPGTTLLNPKSWYRWGTVSKTDDAYEFPDGTIRPGVLLEFESGGEVWVPLENLSKFLVELQ